MFDIVKKSIQWGPETLTLETGRIARQADGSVVIPPALRPYLGGLDRIAKPAT